MDINEIIGHAAALFTTVAYFPQVLQVVKTKSTKDISLGMFLLLALGVFLWFVYGLLIMKWPLILCNGATVLMILVILYYKIRYK